MPVMAHPTYTEAAIADVLAQTRPCRLLVINQGVDNAFRTRLERIAEDQPRVFLWSHQPPLPSLAATWNRALQFVWACGGHAALVVNNDVRLAPNTLAELDGVMGHTDALFVSAIGVGAKQFTPGQGVLPVMLSPPGTIDEARGVVLDRGGPDFSCFYISQNAHWKYPFDEDFVPAYCEDLDLHRRMMLADDGHRIFSVNVPFLHYGSGTLKGVDDKTRARIEQQTRTISRAHYVAKWGGPVNEERYRVPFDPASAIDGVTTPELFAEVQHGQTYRPAQS
jgi:hypothetical protein